MPILQWLRPDIDPLTVTDRQHASLLSGENVMRIGLEAFKADIVKRTEKQRAAAGAANPPSSSSSSMPTAATSRSPRICGASSPAPTSARRSRILQGSSEDVRLDLEENIVECDALVMVYGETTPVWVRGQLRLYPKLKHRRKRALEGARHLSRAAGIEARYRHGPA